ncbi:MAG: signal peptidase I [Clostridia bacterium]|nr:signal peptidase I [Clostridia bacterium]
MKNKTNERKKKKPLQIIGDVFTTVILLAVAALLILFIGVRLVGITPYAVQTASMEPTYPVGSIIYVKNVAASDVKEGDAITYTLNSEGLLATHRVTKIDTGRQLFYTHGDAVEGVEDTPVPFGALVGIPKFSIPKLGFLAQYVATKQGRVIAVTAAAILLVLAIFPQLLSSAEKSDRKKKEEEEKAKAAASPPEPPATRETDPPE